ncbi:MAG: alpha-rhamnosidase, partial [Tannerella sp.]|nr:alpha-rhamnosidase [Tannerella sp.]
MKKRTYRLLCTLLLAGCGIGLLTAATATNLQCEYLVNPLGMDVVAPRFTWQLDDDRHGAAQTAYRIVVGTDSAAVARGTGDMWDTQKMASNRILTTYAGKSLAPFTRYFWSVRLWDADGQELAPRTASFETGMMEMKNWKGAWISDGEHLSGNSIHVKPAPYFRKEFQVDRR